MSVETQFDSFLLEMTGHIVRHGFAMTSVGMGECSIPGCDCTDDDEQPYAYSVGMAEHDLPEVVVLGLAAPFCVELARTVFETALDGDDIPMDEVRWMATIPFKLQPVPCEWVLHDRSRVGMWFGYYQAGREPLVGPEIVQIVWGDAEGRFPDDAECDPYVRECQPLLSTDPYSFPKVAPRSAGRRTSRIRKRTRSHRRAA